MDNDAPTSYREKAMTERRTRCYQEIVYGRIARICSYPEQLISAQWFLREEEQEIKNRISLEAFRLRLRYMR